MSPTQDDSITGRGKDELLPEKGDPFQSSENNHQPADDDKDDAHWMGEIDRQLDAVMAKGDSERFVPGSDRDHGLGAQEDEDFENEIGIPSEPPRMPGQTDTPLDEAIEAVGDQAGEPDPELDFSPETEMGAMPSLDRRGKIVWRWASGLRARIYKEIDNLKLARRMLDQLDLARQQLIQGDVDVEQAERLLGQVEYQLHLSRRVRRWSTTLGPRLLTYDLVWLLVLFIGMLILPGFLIDLIGDSALAATPDAIRTAALTALWGGVGGAVAGLLGLRRHMLQYQDFDRQWSLWYLANPIVGLMLGAMVFLVLRLGLATLAPSTNGEFESAWLAYLSAALAGMQQNRVYDFLGRAVHWVTPKRDAS